MYRIGAALPLCLMLAQAEVYEVGPGKRFATIAQAPWLSLEPGDQVLIYWRAEPYHEKWVIGAVGTAAAPIVVRGVPNDNGDIPVIDGIDAATATYFDYWIADRNIVKIGGSSIPRVPVPRYIVVDGLEIRNARAPYTYKPSFGPPFGYNSNAAGIHIESGANIVIRNCVLHDNGNGIFVSSSDAAPSRDIVIEGNYIYNNGYLGDSQYHNVYSEALGITFQFNRFGPIQGTAVGAGEGNNLKDRSAGTVIRYNWIEGGNRQLDLVESAIPAISQNPSYSETFVYGNVLVDYAGEDNAQITHYGGDGGRSDVFRRGKLYFYNNTVISFRPDVAIMFMLSHPGATLDARNNIFQTSDPAADMLLVERSGTTELRNNWWRQNCRLFEASNNLSGVAKDLGGNLQGVDAGFADPSTLDFGLADWSPAVGMASPLADAAARYPVDMQYQKHRKAAPRTGMDLGAFAAPPQPPPPPDAP